MKILCLLLPLASSWGCGATGGMRQATLVGQCAAGDAACARRHPLAPLAIGSRFHPEVSTEISGTSTPNLRLHSADPGVLTVTDGALVAHRSGASAVLISTEDGAVVDFVHVWVAPVTAITLARRDGERIDGPIGLAVGEDLTLVPALWHDAQRLAGTADATWEVESSGPSPIAVLRDGTPDRRRLRASAPGAARITVAIGPARTSFDVEVVQ